MLQTLAYWRNKCDKKKLEGFEKALASLCKNKISPALFKKRDAESFHQSLMRQATLNLAIDTNNHKNRPMWGGQKTSLGCDFIQNIAWGKGWIPIHEVDKNYSKAVEKLLQRGVLFKHDSKYCLPAECVAQLRRLENPHTWLTIAAQMPITMLSQLVPADAQKGMAQPKPSKNELAAWLMVHGEESRGLSLKALDDKDWELLLLLNQQELCDFDQILSYYPEMPKIIAKGYYGNQHYSLRSGFEKKIPKAILKMCLLGLLGIRIKSGNTEFSSLVLCNEAKSLLKDPFQDMRQRLLKKAQKTWFAEACDIELPSPLHWEQKIWKIWVSLHFIPLGLTQQNSLRKNDLKNLSKLIGDHEQNKVEWLIQHMAFSGLLTQKGNALLPVAIDWVSWAKRLPEGMLRTLKEWSHWTSNEDKKALDLLSQLPTERWLDLNAVETWLDMQATGKLVAANWHGLFIKQQTIALHHVNMEKQRIYFLPQFHAVLNKKTPIFSAPGWHGANKQAKTTGFISASGEIQLPPDCRHDILPKLAEFCTLTSIEHMITLQLDEKALQRIGTNKQILKRTRNLLESLQSPLPQAVAYLFDKQLKQKPIASVAATSMVIHLHDMAAMQRLQRAGFDLLQPFKARPEIVLLDANADADAFMEACVKEGLLLDTLLAPITWVAGMANIKAWMTSSEGRSDWWLELRYQKTRTSKNKQVYAYLLEDGYGWIDIQCVSQSKTGYKLLKTIVALEPKHILHLRELDSAEVKDLGLDKLL